MVLVYRVSLTQGVSNSSYLVNATFWINADEGTKLVLSLAVENYHNSSRSSNIWFETCIE
jgi:hypothetical protein